jgi:hypothetical protein
MSEPPYFREWVRQITISLFVIGGQPLSVADMHTTVNIVMFFALTLNKFLYGMFNIVQTIMIAHYYIKKFISNHFIKIIIFSCTCVLASQTNDRPLLSYAYNGINVIPSICWYFLSIIGKFIISWSRYYLWHLVMLSVSYIAFQIFMSFMRHKPIQINSL